MLWNHFIFRRHSSGRHISSPPCFNCLRLIWLGGLWCYCSTLLDLPFFFSSPVMPCNQFCSQFGMWNFHFFCWKALTIERVGSDGLGGFSSREASEAGAPVSPASAWPFAFSISKIHVFINFGRPCFLSSIFDKANLVVLFWFTFCCHSSLLLCKFSSQGFSWCLLNISAWFFLKIRLWVWNWNNDC